MNDLFEDQEVPLDDELREIVAEKLEQIKRQKEIFVLKKEVSFLEEKLAKAEVDLVRMEYLLDKASESKNDVFQGFTFQMEYINNLQVKNNQLKKKLAQTEKTIADAKEIAENLAPENYPPCERGKFQNLKKLFEEKNLDVDEKQHQIFQMELKKRGIRTLNIQISG